MPRRKKDLAAMAAFAASMYGLNEAKKVDRSLGKMKGPVSDGLSPERKAHWAEITSKDAARNAEITRKDAERNAKWQSDYEKRSAAYDKKDSDIPERSDAKPVESAEVIPFESDDSVVSKKRGGKVSSASSRADGIAQRGKTRGTMIMCGGGMARGRK